MDMDWDMQDAIFGPPQAKKSWVRAPYREIFWLSCGFEPHIGNREHTTFGPSVFAVCLLAPYRGLQRSWGPFRAPSGKAALDASCPARRGRVDCGVAPGGSSSSPLSPDPFAPVGSTYSACWKCARLDPRALPVSRALQREAFQRGAPAPIMPERNPVPPMLSILFTSSCSRQRN